MNEDLLRRLIAYLASVKEDRDFIRSVAQALDTDEKRERMIEYIRSNEDLSTSKIYIKEMQINGKLEET